MTTVRNTTAFMQGINLVAPVGYIATDANCTLTDVGYASSATSTQRSAGAAFAAAWTDPPLIPCCDTKRLTQAMANMGCLNAFITAYTLVKATDVQRWYAYNVIRQDNPVFARICAKAVPCIDPMATMLAALALPMSNSPAS